MKMPRHCTPQCCDPGRGTRGCSVRAPSPERTRPWAGCSAPGSAASPWVRHQPCKPNRPRWVPGARSAPQSTQVPNPGRILHKSLPFPSLPLQHLLLRHVAKCYCAGPRALPPPRFPCSSGGCSAGWHGAGGISIPLLQHPPGSPLLPASAFAWWSPSAVGSDPSCGRGQKEQGHLLNAERVSCSSPESTSPQPVLPGAVQERCQPQPRCPRPALPQRGRLQEMLPDLAMLNLNTSSSYA